MDGVLDAFFFFYTLAERVAVIHQGQSGLSQTLAVRRVHKGPDSGVDCLPRS